MWIFFHPVVFEKKKEGKGKMKRRVSCRKADLSLCSLRPVVWALTLFDIEMPR